jgi:hypothetical protein
MRLLARNGRINAKCLASSQLVIGTDCVQLRKMNATRRQIALFYNYLSAIYEYMLSWKLKKSFSGIDEITLNDF